MKNIILPQDGSIFNGVYHYNFQSFPYSLQFVNEDKFGKWFNVKFLGINQDFLEEDLEGVFNEAFILEIEDYLKNLNTEEEKKKQITLRLYESDIPKIKSIAKKEGLPYQTFLASKIHKIAMES